MEKEAQAIPDTIATTVGQQVTPVVVGSCYNSSGGCCLLGHELSRSRSRL